MFMRLRPYLLNLLLLALAVLLSFSVGAVAIPPLTILRLLATQLPGLSITPDWPPAFAAILFDIRLPHTLLMALTGAALAGSGAAFQGLFRNPLADPYLIGVAAGAGLGAVLAMSLGWPRQFLGYLAVPLAAFAGALLAVWLVYLLARTGQTTPTTTLILAGIAVSSFASALTSFLMLRSTNELRRAISWLLGGAAAGGWLPVWASLPYIVIALVALLLCAHALNVLQFGDDQAQQLGLPVEKIKLIILLAASLAAAAAVAFSGIIGFIGLITPHLMRLLSGPDYRRLLPLSILAGATALLLADVLARLVLAPQVLPVGLVTALAGGPFFLWVLRRARQQTYF